MADAFNGDMTDATCIMPVRTQMNPAMLGEWLKTHSASPPRTFIELRVIGLHAAVVEWLEQKINTRETRSISEQEVVEAFIYVILRWYTQLPKSFFLRWFKGMFENKSKLSRMRVNDVLVEEIIVAFDGIKEDAWPEKMLIDPARIRLNYLGRILSELHGQRRCKISDDGATARTAQAGGAVTSQGVWRHAHC